ncbi:MFS transporter [Bacillus sp. 1P06AnD]|uniref:MFS transporter n=1 Tax=Bacillus sp. 1P06AnD TaxID=3132208 RepID=UPI0039A015FE
MGKKGFTKNKLLGIAGLGWMFDAMDVGILSFVLAAMAEDWGLTSSQIGLAGSINSIGMMAGAFLFGLMADRKGRKFVFILTLLLFSIGSGLSALTASFAVFLCLRFIIGMGLGGELPVASTLVSETVEPHERGRIVVLLESFWAGGWIIAALISYFIIPKYGWRAAMLICTLPALYALYLRVGLPDSQQFTSVSKRKVSIWKQITEVWDKPHRQKTAMLWILWFCVVFSYYGMFLWLPSVMVLKGYSLIKSFQYVFIMTLAQLPGYFTVAWLIERAGRKFVLVVYLMGTAVSAFFFGSAESLGLLVVSGAFLSFFNLGAWGALYAYTPEQYPAIMRGAGSGMAASAGRLGGVFGPLLIGSLVAEGVSTSSIFLIFCIAIIIGALAVLLLGTETKQKKLDLM